MITLQHLIIQFLLYYLANGDAYERLKTIENLKLLALRVVVVTYKVVAYMYNRFQNNSALTKGTYGMLENWSPRRGGCLQEVAATRDSTVFWSIILAMYQFTLTLKETWKQLY